MKLGISSLVLELRGITEYNIPANALLFNVKDDDSRISDLIYTFHFLDKLPQLDLFWKLKYQRPNLLVFAAGKREARIIGVGDNSIPYAEYEEVDDRNINVYFFKAIQAELQIDTIFLSCLSLERHLAERGCYILHCAFLVYKGQAILFSGPSGIGKSTHADLWCKNISNCHIVNGDRCLICLNKDGTYEACGWPICGSSEICFKEHYPLKAIVFMEQSVINHVVEESLMSYYKRLTAQITINHWNVEATGKALDWMLKLVQTIKITTYACNMNSDAPVILHDYLFAE
ncbi:hypothetical protein [Phocaeicola oris]|uniref:hypothetical protein n=1 Tax=Phocaeicola oris TaxID=2896850 RepID=UPI00234F02AD|nr:hypothetical protein [Phocaeicola oris]MCE2617215.1 hypothetical protein [Phocaeicola oris]